MARRAREYLMDTRLLSCAQLETCILMLVDASKIEREDALRATSTARLPSLPI